MYIKIPTENIDDSNPGPSESEQEPELVLEESINNKLWNESNTRLLINLVEKHEKGFETGIKRFIWQKISTEISEQTGVTYTAVQVDTKWKGLVKTYKEILKHNKTTGKNRKEWKYFEVMNRMLYKRPEITPVATCSSTSGLVVRERDKENKSESDEPGESKDQEEKFMSNFTRKRKVQENAVEKRHQDKMLRLDRLQGTLDRMLDVLAKKHN